MNKPSPLSIILSLFVLAGLAAGSYLLLRLEWNADLDYILHQPPPTAGREEPLSKVIATDEMDRVALAVLSGLPENNSRRTEQVGYLYRDQSSSKIKASAPRAVVTRTRGRTAYATVHLPSKLDIRAVYHDHFRGTVPGPGQGDAGPVYQGMVSYLRDHQGNIFKIEYSAAWKNQHNNFNGWKLVTLQGEQLQGQEQWQPGAILPPVQRQ